MIEIDILNKLNAPTREERLANLKEILKTTEFPPMVPQYINNHIHTTYSFSPYSPTAAVYAARMEGLCTAGIIDHDSISGAREFLAAAELVGMLLTLLFSKLRTFWLRLTASRPQGRFEKPRTEAPEEEASDTPEDAETKANIAKIVQEVLAQQAAEKAACENDANDADDFELQRMVSTFKLLRSKGYTLRILPGTPEENAPVFDFAAESIQPAA